MGKLASHTCSPDPEHADWFNIAVDEIGEIAAYLKNSVNRRYLFVMQGINITLNCLVI
jgi:hypothetical protein